MKIGAPHILAVAVVAAATVAQADNHCGQDSLRDLFDSSRYVSNAIEFPQFIVGNVAAGKGVFGLSPDNQIDPTLGGIFEGDSVIYGEVTSNGTVCASCHRPDTNFMLPQAPISAHVPAGDALLSGRNAEAQDDPRAAALFENHGLLKQRVNRFNPLMRHPAADTNPDAYHLAYYNVFSWRKTQTIWNVVFGFGYLTDGRARHLIEQGRGAAFTHTQDTDIRFDDLVNPHLNDVAAWQQTVVFPAALSGLLDPTSPDYDSLVNDPFFTVPTTTSQQHQGEQVFAQQCMSCHNMPNVFGNRAHLAGPPANYPPLYGQTFDIGVSQRNRWNLDVREYDATTHHYSTVTLSLAREDGSRVDYPVMDDIGAAETTGRYEDLHRFKVPQLRKIKDLGPYFHDNSALTLDEVVDYFNSDAYNNSSDGRTHPVHLSHSDRAALLAFLQIL